MTQAVDFEMLAMAQVDCLDAPSPSECHGQICGLLCGDAARDRIEALVDLQARLEQLMTERAHLIQKNELARNRLEGIVSRLKDMEEGSV